jgi:hypothetical protein
MVLLIVTFWIIALVEIHLMRMSVMSAMTAIITITRYQSALAVESKIVLSARLLEMNALCVILYMRPVQIRHHV